MIPVYAIYPSLPWQTLSGSVKFYPSLSLGVVISYAKKYQKGVLKKKYRFVQKFFLNAEELKTSYKEHGPGVFLFPNYVWSLSNNLAIAAAVKSWDRRNITIFGGPSIPLKEEELNGLMKSHSQVDICVRGEGEVSLAEVLDCLGDIVDIAANKSIEMSVLKDVSGLAYRFRKGNGSEDLIYTAEREMISDLRNFPSPYLNGDFDEEEISMWAYAMLETNRGCPYHCSYCNWGGGVGGKVYNFPLKRVIDEINWAARNKIPGIGICDANFGMYDRDIEIAKAAAAARRKYGYPREFVMSYPKSQVKRLVEIAKILTEAGVAAFGTLSIQTIDPTVLKCANRKNIKIKELTKLISDFRKAELPLATDIMIGLPGSTVRSVKNDLQFSFDNQLAVKCYSAMALPNTSLTESDYVKRYKLEFDQDGFIKSSYSFNEMDQEEMKAIIHAYRLYVSYSILKYILGYLQLEHNIKAMEVLHDLTKFFYHPSENYSEIYSFSRGIIENREHPEFALFLISKGGWDLFYDEVRRYLVDGYGIKIDSGLETAIKVQKAVMPRLGRKFPDMINLQHDFPSYFFEDFTRDGTSNQRKLTEFPEGYLEVSDPQKICENLSHGEIMKVSHFVYWELNTVLAPKTTVVYDVNLS